VKQESGIRELAIGVKTMRWKTVSWVIVIALALVAVEGCGGGGGGKRKSSKNRTTPTNVVQNEWLKIPGGEYRVGDEKYPNFKGGKVNIEDFHIQKYEVTHHQYKQWLDSLPAEQREEHTPKGDPITGEGAWEDGWYPEGLENHPVTNVTLADADAYARAIGGLVPDRIHWEIAARGPDSNVFPWGNTFDAKRANFNNREAGTMPVGSFEAGKSWCGAYDMAGNVWEWTTSYFDRGRSPFRLLKGGCYLSDNPADCEGANSYSAEPDTVDVRFGFRCYKQ
jgi:formylglycine-generating enzyme required for sulfatase activity